MSLIEEWLAARVEDDAGCKIWKLQVSPNGAPLARSPLPNAPKYKVQVRRLVWESRNGPVPDHLRVTYTCENPRCLSCLALTTPKEVLARMFKRPDVRARKVAGLTKARRAIGKLDMEKARYVRQSSGTLKEVSEELGISMTLASLIRRGILWKESIGNPFAGLGA